MIEASKTRDAEQRRGAVRGKKRAKVAVLTTRLELHIADLNCKSMATNLDYPLILTNSLAITLTRRCEYKR